MLTWCCSSGKNKYHKTHYVSEAALEQLNAAVGGELVWEHLVPKDHVQGECVGRAIQGALGIQFVRDRLRTFWWTATVTADENRLLKPCRAMPDGWIGTDIAARYRDAKLSLVPNPFFEQILRQSS